MREQLVGIVGASKVGSFAGRPIQRTDVGEDRQLTAGEQRMHLGQRRMQAEHPAAFLRLDLQQLRLRDVDAAGHPAYGSVLGITGSVGPNDDIVAIIATKKEDADQRLVVNWCRLRPGWRDAKTRQRRDSSASAQRVEKFTTGVVHDACSG